MIFLSAAELLHLTGQKQRAAQKRALRRMKIPHEVNCIGELLVSRSYIERRFSGNDEHHADEAAPNFGFLSHGKTTRHSKSRLLAS